MKRLMWLIAALVLAGCGYQKVAVPASDGHLAVLVQERKLTDDQKLTLLRQTAHTRELRWKIICTSGLDKPDEAFLAIAERNTSAEPWILFTEDGGQWHWYAFGATQAEAAYELVKSIEYYSQPPSEPMHKPKKKPDAYCPPELRGE